MSSKKGGPYGLPFVLAVDCLWQAIRLYYIYTNILDRCSLIEQLYTYLSEPMFLQFHLLEA